ncbi:MAG: MarR family transcriptional regulator [Rhodospirillales bacterium]|nr:MarR family transcriptional regulator [Rhodospirillales bacterium]MCB9996951.1 MarR family transcriptional regulator [Rhodospirillales bacterium]
MKTKAANNRVDISLFCEEMLATCAVTNLRKLSRHVTNGFNEKIKHLGLKTTQICVIQAIGQNQGQPMSFYADELCMDLSTLTRSLHTLEKAGLIRLEPGHRREKLAYLTDAGAEKITEAYPLWQEAQKEFISKFGEECWKNFLNAAHSTTD